MGTQGIDVILGMKCLHKNQAIVNCDKRTVRLVSPSGEEIVIELIMFEPEQGVCHQMTVDGTEANPLEAIRVVLEFPDVFPKEVPGISPER